jgi:hypothetical protein
VRAVPVWVGSVAVADEILFGHDAHVAVGAAPVTKSFVAALDARIEHGDADARAVESARRLCAHEVCAGRRGDVAERAHLAVGRDVGNFGEPAQLEHVGRGHLRAHETGITESVVDAHARARIDGLNAAPGRSVETADDVEESLAIDRAA